jgi:hypothetical protein
VFTRDNAVLCLSGAVPAGLRLQLADGRRLPVPAAEPWEQPVPAIYGHSWEGVILSGLVERSTAEVAASHILSGRVVDQLRHRDGLSYSPGSVYEPINGDTAVAAVWADVTADEIPAALPVALGAALDLASNGPTEEELDDHVRAAVLRMEDPQQWPVWAWTTGRDHLLGATPMTVARSLAELRALEPAEVARAATQLCDSVLVGVPGVVTVDQPGYPVLRGPGNTTLPGRPHRPVAGAVELVALGGTMVVNSTLLQHRLGGSSVTVDLPNVAGALAWPDGARVLVRPDGYRVRIEPKLWRRGEELTRRIDAHVPADRMLWQPERPVAERPRPLNLWERIVRTDPWTLALHGATLFLLALMPFAIVVAIATSNAAIATPVIIGLLVVALFSFLRGLLRGL